MNKVAQLKTNKEKVLEPKSVRLTQAHRSDMLNAVMAEWEKQNPAPAQAKQVELLKLVAKEVKKHPVYKSTQRIIAALEPFDLKAVSKKTDFLVKFVNKQGEERRTEQMEIPFDLAESLGLTGIPQSAAIGHYTAYDPDLHDVNKILGYSHDVRDGKLKEGDRIKYLMFTLITASSYVAVVLDDESPGMAKMKAKRKERDNWLAERDRLRNETSDLLQQFASSKQIRDGWPEMVPYMPAHIADPTHAVKLPVLATSRLNERLGIK